MGKIIVSFKKNEEGLYDLVNSKGDKSNFIKDALKFYLQNDKKECTSGEVHPSGSGDEIRNIMEEF